MILREEFALVGPSRSQHPSSQKLFCPDSCPVYTFSEPSVIVKPDIRASLVVCEPGLNHFEDTLICHTAEQG